MWQAPEGPAKRRLPVSKRVTLDSTGKLIFKNYRNLIHIKGTHAEVLKALVVDDERVIADTLAVILRQHGYQASAVYSGTAAIQHARQFSPDLIISDVVMPDINGIEVAIQVLDFLPSCKILLFSGQAATADLLEEARERGYEFEILSKPVHPHDLLAKLSRFKKQ